MAAVARALPRAVLGMWSVPSYGSAVQDTGSAQSHGALCFRVVVCV